MLKIVIAIIIFGVIIIFHELGHFLLAKKNGICVEEFALGIGPTLIGIQKGETKYSIKCLPVGGCCMMLGEDGESEDPRAFGSKSALARFSVVFAGPFFNFILALFLAFFMIGLGGTDPAVIGEVTPGGAAQEAGLKPGDEILRLDGSRIYNFREITLYNFMHNTNPEVEVTYRRDGEQHRVIVGRKAENGSYLFGVTRTGDVSAGPLGVLKYSVLEVRFQIKSTLASLGYLIRGKASVNDMSGPVGIVNMMGETYEQSVGYGIRILAVNMLSFAILLSANLGVMNLLPLPALDGGRLLFIIIEMVRRKKISPDKEGMVHFAGLIILLAFMIFVMANDIRNIFFT